MKIVIDYDSTLVATHDAVLELYRKQTGDYSTRIDDRNLKWNMAEVCPLWSKDDLENIFTNPELFDYIKAFPNAITTLNNWHKQGDYLEICSLHRMGAGSVAKREWIKENIPFINKITIIPLISETQPFDKSSVTGDIIIDDKIDCLLSSPCRYKICYGDYSWNRSWENYQNKNWIGFRALDWDEVAKIVKEIRNGTYENLFNSDK